MDQKRLNVNFDFATYLQPFLAIIKQSLSALKKRIKSSKTLPILCI